MNVDGLLISDSAGKLEVVIEEGIVAAVIAIGTEIAKNAAADLIFVGNEAGHDSVQS